MDEVLAGLAMSGAQTIVTLMTTDLWRGMRHKVAQIFSRSDQQQFDHLVSDLEDSRNLLIAAGEPSKQAIAQQEQDRWEARIRLCLIDQPTVAQLIRQLIEEARAAGMTATNSGQVSIHAHVQDNARVYQQGYGIQENG